MTTCTGRATDLIRKAQIIILRTRILVRLKTHLRSSDHCSMKKMTRCLNYRSCLFVLLALLSPLSAHSSQPAAFDIPVSGLLIQVQRAVKTQLAFAFPPPLGPQRDRNDDNNSLRFFALLQLALLTIVATWWRLRLGHWGLR